MTELNDNSKINRLRERIARASELQNGIANSEDSFTRQRATALTKLEVLDAVMNFLNGWEKDLDKMAEMDEPEPEVDSDVQEDETNEALKAMFPGLEL